MIHSPIKTWLIYTSYLKDLRKKSYDFSNSFPNTLFQLTSDDKWRKVSSSVFLYNLISKHEDKWWGRVEKPDK